MTRADFSEAIARMDPAQFEAVRVCIMAERRLRHIFPRDAHAGPAMEEAYAWALSAKPSVLIKELTP